ncbi:DNA breaking-rejoining protein, partial [Cronobacter sakazakii]|nr:DNA breaking-rejoining protein [Cronobacter sakazakii]
VTGVAAGTSTITFKSNDGSFTATCAVTVTAS